MPPFRPLAALALAATAAIAATGAHADVLGVGSSTQIALGSGPGFNQPYFLDEFGVTSPNGIAASGYVDIDRSVIPAAGGSSVYVYGDAILGVQMTIGNKTLGFHDNPAVSGGQATVYDSSGGGDSIAFATPALNGLAARPSNETPLASPAYSYVFDWATASTLSGAYFGLSSLYLYLDEYDMLSSRDLNNTAISQPYPSASHSRLNFELVMSSSPTADFFAPGNARYYGQSTSGFSLSGAPLVPTTPNPPSSVPEPASLALAGLALAAAGAATKRRRLTPATVA